MKNELILYSQNLLKLALVSAFIGLCGLAMQPKGPQNGSTVLAMLPSSSR